MPCARCGRSPAFSWCAIAVLALGIAGNTAMFSLVDAVRLRALPYAESDRLVVLWGNVMRAQLERRGASYPDFIDWRAQATSFEGMAAVDETRMTLSGLAKPPASWSRQYPASYFPLLRANAAAGRTFAADEDLVPQKVGGRGAVRCVLAPSAWQRSAGCRSRARARRRPFTVVGHHAAGFSRPRRSCRRLGSVRHERHGRGPRPSAATADFRCSPG